MEKKIRVHALAKELGISNPEMIQLLQENGVDVKSHMSSIESELADIIREDFLGDDNTAEVEVEAEETITEEVVVEKTNSNELHLKSPVVVKDLAEALNLKANVVIGDLMKEKVLATINQVIEPAVAERIASKHGKTLLVDKREKSHVTQKGTDVAPEDVVHKSGDKDMKLRPPVVAFLGHVDHGKTSLQDALRKTDVTAGEAGGITQHVGCSVIDFQGQTLTMIDTPGHAAFTAMRARGANTTDIAILVVAADDGIMPQTAEAIRHIKAAGVPMIVAMNKMDLEAADPDTVLRQLQQNEVMPEDWGGEIAVMPVSAHSGQGLDELLERILLEAEMLELKADPSIPGKAVVIETKMEAGTGVHANILVQDGSIKVGDVILCGANYGKVKAMINDKGERVKIAGPSTPVQLLGLSEVPEVGFTMVVCKNERQAKKLAEVRKDELRQERLRATIPGTTLEDLFQQVAENEKAELSLIVKADVKGSLEAINDALTQFPSDKVRLNVVSSAIGAITETDVTLAKASNAIVVGFHVRVNPGVNKLAERDGVEIRLYSIIYELLEDVKEALEGKLAPEEREEELGDATILQLFTVGKGEKICGCRVNKGVIQTGAKARVFRGKELIYYGSIANLRHLKDTVKEVKQGFECGIRLDNFEDFEEHDTVKVYKTIQEKAKL